jgi:Icc-related predicted phosphoesterase
MKPDSELEEVYSSVPGSVDVLITHGPAWGILDEVPVDAGESERVGGRALKESLCRIDPDVHCFGHIHESYGRTTKNGTQHVNASIMSGDYDPVNDPIVIDLEYGGFDDD